MTCPIQYGTVEINRVQHLFNIDNRYLPWLEIDIKLCNSLNEGGWGVAQQLGQQSDFNKQ